MDFEDILNQWDKFDNKKNITKTPKKIKIVNDVSTMADLLSMYPPDDNSGETPVEAPTERQKRRNYRRMKAQERLDLHGFSMLSAKIELDDFLIRCKKRKIEKILIIHGKGLHSPDGEAVLRNYIRNELKSLPFIGEIGHPSEKEGGAGATWAIIRY